ncbi:MAG: peptidoglycan DD-metalloendopeptidase family protein [bacterium]|nr:peptidoglycan DD-metalloendopeptidase family protein [bacterium]
MHYQFYNRYKIIAFLALFLVSIGFIEANTFTNLINSDGSDLINYKTDHLSKEFDSTFNTAWQLYLNTWDNENLNPYLYDYNSFNEPVSLCLSYDSIGFCIPIASMVTSEFGTRWGKHHQGVDLDLETGDSVVSAFDGVVRMSRYYFGYGNMVVIRHHNGLETLYGHLSKNIVEVGQSVKAGEVLGLGGNTGHSFGSHLHFEMRFMGKPIDPAKFIAFDKFSLLNNEITIDGSLFENNKLVKKSRSGNVDHSESHYTKAKKSQSLHVVKRGDTLSAIARKHHTTVVKLCKLNKIKATAILPLGKKLKVK